MFAQYGSDEQGWVDHLALQLNVGGTFYAYFIEEGDLEGDLDAIVTGIVRQQVARADTAQKGVALGQFVKPSAIAASDDQRGRVEYDDAAVRVHCLAHLKHPMTYNSVVGCWRCDVDGCGATVAIFGPQRG